MDGGGDCGWEPFEGASNDRDRFFLGKARNPIEMLPKTGKGILLVFLL